MPSFFPEGDAPLPTDSESRSLSKAVSLLKNISAEGNDAAFKVGSDDIEITNAAKGIIFRDSNGVRHRYRAGTEGQLIEEIVT